MEHFVDFGQFSYVHTVHDHLLKLYAFESLGLIFVAPVAPRLVREPLSDAARAGLHAREPPLPAVSASRSRIFSDFSGSLTFG